MGELADESPFERSSPAHCTFDRLLLIMSDGDSSYGTSDAEKDEKRRRGDDGDGDGAGESEDEDAELCKGDCKIGRNVPKYLQEQMVKIGALCASAEL